MMNIFYYQTKIKLHETDAAGVIFFNNLFKIAHDAYEALLEKINFSIKEILEKLGKNYIHKICVYP